VAKDTSSSSGLAQISSSELVRTYVWEKPVRISHWLMFFALLFLSITGLYMHRPFMLPSSRVPNLMAWMRFIHEISGFLLIGAITLRIYWFFKGNVWSRWYSYIPIHPRQWVGIGDMLEFYLFMRFKPGRKVGHNPLAALSYFIIYVLIVVEILTGLALFDHVRGNPFFHQIIGWLPQAVPLTYLRLVHFFLTFIFFAFVIFHVYASVLVSIEEKNGLLDSIFSGWKFIPAGELRHEIAAIPEAREFAKSHQLVTEKEAAHEPPAQTRPGPGPIVLFRNWISYAGTGLAAVGVLVFVVLTAYHTIGGGALTQPYGDLVIFLVPPMFVLFGGGIVLFGMYVQWIRWRLDKPLAFGRYPKWDLNVARERKALLAVGMGAAIISVPAVFGSYQAYVYTDSVSFCGTVCHSMSPEYGTYTSSAHARVDCAQCHIAQGATGYVVAKLRGMQELMKTIQDDYPRPIPVHVASLRPIRTTCEECHWAPNFFGSREVRRTYFLSDEQNTRWEIDLSTLVGGDNPQNSSQKGSHWHVSAKVEYVSTDTERQKITWIRSVDPKTGAAREYTSDPEGSAGPKGEVHTMDCVDCHNRPSHTLESPERILDAGLADGHVDVGLPFIKQQGITVLGTKYADREQAKREIDTTLRNYYQKTYPDIYARKKEALQSAVDYLRNTYERNFFPSMNVRWDTYPREDSHFYSQGCFRCHDGQHKAVDGSVIRSDCDTCHKILQQGKAETLQFAKGPEGLKFEHPADIGDAWTQMPCNSCHTGGPM